MSIASKAPPNNWTQDKLTEFIEIAHQNGFATFVNFPNWIRKLVEVDSLFRRASDVLSHGKAWFESFFFLRSHSSYLSAARLALSGQQAEAFIILRGAIEWVLYGHFFKKSPELAETWLNLPDLRKTDPDIVYKFSTKRLLESLKADDKSLSKIVEKLYSRCIEFGAHPNEKALLSALKIEELPGEKRFEIGYLNVDKLSLEHGLKSSAQVGVVCLKVWEMVFAERFKIAGIANGLKTVQEGL